ncbi:uncharacterized protein LOC144106965 [Amblyomma americanum]
MINVRLLPPAPSSTSPPPPWGPAGLPLLLATVLFAVVAAVRPVRADLLDSLCAILGDPELCRDGGRVRRHDWEATTTWGPFQEIVGTSSRRDPAAGRDIPWKPGRVVFKDRTKARPGATPGANWSLPAPEPPPPLEIDFDNVTYAVDDPVLPWTILEYFANLQVEVSYVENVEKRKAYSGYLFRKMNVYLSVVGADATVKLAPRGYFSPEFFVRLVNRLSVFLVLVMTVMLAWFVGFLAYWYYWSQWEAPPAAVGGGLGDSGNTRTGRGRLRSAVRPDAGGSGKARSRSCDDGCYGFDS